MSQFHLLPPIDRSSVETYAIQSTPCQQAMGDKTLKIALICSTSEKRATEITQSLIKGSQIPEKKKFKGFFWDPLKDLDVRLSTREYCHNTNTWRDSNSLTNSNIVDILCVVDVSDHIGLRVSQINAVYPQVPVCCQLLSWETSRDIRVSTNAPRNIVILKNKDIYAAPLMLWDLARSDLEWREIQHNYRKLGSKLQYPPALKDICNISHRDPKIEQLVKPCTRPGHGQSDRSTEAEPTVSPPNQVPLMAQVVEDAALHSKGILEVNKHPQGSRQGADIHYDFNIPEIPQAVLGESNLDSLVAEDIRVIEGTACTPGVPRISKVLENAPLDTVPSKTPLAQDLVSYNVSVNAGVKVTGAMYCAPHIPILLLPDATYIPDIIHNPNPLGGPIWGPSFADTSANDSAYRERPIMLRVAELTLQVLFWILSVSFLRWLWQLNSAGVEVPVEEYELLLDGPKQLATVTRGDQVSNIYSLPSFLQRILVFSKPVFVDPVRTLLRTLLERLYNK